MAVPSFPVETLGLWTALRPRDRAVWLERARDHAFATSVAREPDRTGIDVRLDVSAVSTLDDFFCALGEAVGGPGGYFGLSMHALEDCLVGGFGLRAPWTLRVSDPERLRRELGSAALLAHVEWSRRAHADFIREEGAAWLAEAERAARAGELGLWDVVAELLEHYRVRVVDDRE